MADGGKEFEPRVGAFRQQAVDHLMRSETPVGGPIPRVIPFLWPLVGAISLAVMVFVLSLVLIQVEDVVMISAVSSFTTRSGSASFQGQNLVVQVDEAKRDAIHEGQAARIRFGEDAHAPEALAVVMGISDKGECNSAGRLVFPVKLRFTSEPTHQVPPRDLGLTVSITTRRRSALASFLRRAD